MQTTVTSTGRWSLILSSSVKCYLVFTYSTSHSPHQIASLTTVAFSDSPIAPNDNTGFCSPKPWACLFRPECCLQVNRPQNTQTALASSSHCQHFHGAASCRCITTSTGRWSLVLSSSGKSPSRTMTVDSSVHSSFAFATKMKSRHVSG